MAVKVGMVAVSRQHEVRSGWAVVFDCDGVLVDSEPLGQSALEMVTRKYRLPVNSRELSRYCGCSDLATYSDLVARYGSFCAPGEFLAEIRAAFDRTIKVQGLRMCPGVNELVGSLRNEGIPYGVGSSGQLASIRTSLSVAGLYNLFSVVVASDHVARPKPDPDIFLEVARRLQADPIKCIVIEDTPTGIEAARNAGMACVAVTTSFPRAVLREADWIIDTLLELSVPILHDLVRNRQPEEGRAAR
jgi:HAD superfamily hydrolase (TIGR01509 family)